MWSSTRWTIWPLPSVVKKKLGRAITGLIRQSAFRNMSMMISVRFWIFRSLVGCCITQWNLTRFWLGPVKRHRNDYVRSPAFYISSHISAHRFRIIFPIFTAPVIFIPKKRILHLRIIQKHTSSTNKFPFSVPTFTTIFFRLIYRFSTFHAIIF